MGSATADTSPSAQCQFLARRTATRTLGPARDMVAAAQPDTDLETARTAHWGGRLVLVGLWLLAMAMCQVITAEEPGLTVARVTVDDALLPPPPAGALIDSVPQSLTGSQADEPTQPIVSGGADQSAAPGCYAGGYWIISARERDCEPGCGQRLAGLVVTHHQLDGCVVQRSVADWAAAAGAGGPVIVMAHGSFVTAESMQQDSLATYRWLWPHVGCMQPTITFLTWPSDDAPTHKLLFAVDVAVLGRRAERYGLVLADLIAQVPNHRPIGLIGHSHGSRLILATAGALAGSEIDGERACGAPYQGHRLRLVLAAAAVEHHWLKPGERYAAAINRSEAIVNLQNRRDLALRLYPLHRVLARPTLAKAGFRGRTLAAHGSQSSKLQELDVTDQIGVGHIWSHYYGQPGLAASLGPFLSYQQ